MLRLTVLQIETKIPKRSATFPISTIDKKYILYLCKYFFGKGKVLCNNVNFLSS